MAQPHLSREDVVRLLSDPSASAKVETAAKLARDFDQGSLSESEKQLAEDIFRLMAQDAEIQVRQALAINLKESMALPHDVAVRLAEDVDTVALPVLQFSMVLSDDDLVRIVKSQGSSKQRAIAVRPSVSESLSEALVEMSDADAVSRLVANDGAQLSEPILQKVIDHFGETPDIQDPLIRRALLPVTVAERLVTLVSDQMRQTLIDRHHLPQDIVSSLIKQSRERATITLAAGIDREDVEALVRQLKEHGRLTPSLLLRAVCMGDMPFFEAAMAELGDVPLLNAQQLIHDPGRKGFLALYSKVSLPSAMAVAFLCAIDVAHETELDGGEMDRERYCRRMIERILTKYEIIGVTFDSSDLDYLLAKMDKLPASLIQPPED